MAEADVERLRKYKTDYNNRFTSLLKYAARFLLLVGEEARGGKRYNEVFNLLSVNLPPFEAAEEAVRKKIDKPAPDVGAFQEGRQLTEAKLQDAELQQVVDKVVDLLKKELNVSELDDDVINQIADTIAPETIEQREVEPSSKLDQKIQGIAELLTSGTADADRYIEDLENKFLKYVVAKAKALGPARLAQGNESLSDAGKKAFASFKPDSLDNDAVRNFLSVDTNFNKTVVDQVADNIKSDISKSYEDYTKPKKTNESKYNFNITEARKSGLLTEGFVGMFGAWVKLILKSIFGDVDLPIGVSGSKNEVEAFARAIQGEKRYIDSIQKYGLSNRQTYQSRAKLASSIRSFESETGLKWPFK